MKPIGLIHWAREYDTSNSHQQGTESEGQILEVKLWETDIPSAMIRIILFCKNSELDFSIGGLTTVVFAPFVSGFELELIHMRPSSSKEDSWDENP